MYFSNIKKSSIRIPNIHNGEIISYSIISKHLSAKNIIDAPEKAIKVTVKFPYRRTFHSDKVGLIK